MTPYEVTICDDNGVPDWSQSELITVHTLKNGNTTFDFSPRQACLTYIDDYGEAMEPEETLKLAVRNHGVYEVRAFLAMDYAVEKLD